MRAKYVGNKADKISVVVKNAETVAIDRGTPVVLQMNGTDDGLAVVLPSTAGDVPTSAFRYGVALDTIAANGGIGEAQVYGFCSFVKVCLQTRANTSGGSSFSTADSVALGVILTIGTAVNAFQTLAQTVAAASSDAQTLTNRNQDLVRIAQSLATTAGVATATSETRTAITQGVKAFLRMM